MEWDGGRPGVFRKGVTTTSPLGKWLIDNSLAHNTNSGLLQADFPTSASVSRGFQATARRIFETTMRLRDINALSNFSIGATQMYMGPSGQGRIRVMKNDPNNWDALWGYYIGNPTVCMMYASSYLDSKPYPADQPSHDNVVRWLASQTGGGNPQRTEDYYSGKEDYRGWLGNVMSLAQAVPFPNV
jgi:hypothetical protein